MNNVINVYTLTHHRTKETVERFLATFTNQKTIDEEKNLELIVIPEVATDLFFMDEYDRIKVKTIQQAIKTGLSKKKTCLLFYVRSKLPGTNSAKITFTTDNKLVLGISMEEYKDHTEKRDNYGLAMNIKDQLHKEFQGSKSYIGKGGFANTHEKAFNKNAVASGQHIFFCKKCNKEKYLSGANHYWQYDKICSLCLVQSRCMPGQLLISLLDQSIYNTYTCLGILNYGLSTGQVMCNMLKLSVKHRDKFVKLIGKRTDHSMKLRWEKTENSFSDSTGMVDDLKEAVRRESRFFNKRAEKTLQQLLDNTAQLKGSFIKTIRPGKKQAFYRARVAHHSSDVNNILHNPVVEMGRPPFHLAKEGRLNPVGVPMLYCSADINTCIAEVRPMVGDFVVVAEFELVKEIQLLSLNYSKELLKGASPFDPEFENLYDASNTLRELFYTVSKPQSFQPGAYSYLLSQYFSEFLEFHVEPKIQAIEMQSTQYPKGLNYCFLRNYSRIKGPDVEDVKRILHSTVFRNEARFRVNFEKDILRKKPAAKVIMPDDRFNQEINGEQEEQHEAFLKMKNIVVRKIYAVGYGAEIQSFNMTEKTADKFGFPKESKPDPRANIDLPF